MGTLHRPTLEQTPSRSPTEIWPSPSFKLSLLRQIRLLLLRAVMDCIHINGIRAYGYTGALPEEQVLGQWFEVDLTVWLDVSAAIKSDRLEDTHDYCADVKAVQDLLRTRKFNLIETAAGTIADIVLSSPKVEQVQVRLTKVAAPIPDFDGKIAVEITRANRREG